MYIILQCNVYRLYISWIRLSGLVLHSRSSLSFHVLFLWLNWTQVDFGFMKVNERINVFCDACEKQTCSADSAASTQLESLARYVTLSYKCQTSGGTGGKCLKWVEMDSPDIEIFYCICKIFLVLQIKSLGTNQNY